MGFWTGSMGDFERLIREATEAPFSGWDFSAIAIRWRQGHPPWKYNARVRNRIAKADSLLDLGTGGGERLSSLQPLSPTTFATEGYRRNLRIARRRLRPLGVQVIPVGTDLRPQIPDTSGDLVTSHHKDFNATEVYRVLRPGGQFITQHVGIRNYHEINDRFGVAPEPPTNDVTGARALAAEIAVAGFRILTKKESHYLEYFRDVGALVYYLRAAPWQVPSFSPDRSQRPLRGIHREIQSHGRFRVTAYRLLVIAERIRWTRS
ncbi:MAG: methyltransferase domain-containing protein [Thermoplasmata archaeon]